MFDGRCLHLWTVRRRRTLDLPLTARRAVRGKSAVDKRFAFICVVRVFLNQADSFSMKSLFAFAYKLIFGDSSKVKVDPGYLPGLRAPRPAPPLPKHIRKEPEVKPSSINALYKRFLATRDSSYRNPSGRSRTKKTFRPNAENPSNGNRGLFD